ncbi:MAG: MoaD/ThiS family protein [Alphaproteobacteria bacterium]
MARIAFTPNLQRHVACPPMQAEGATVRSVLDHAFAARPDLRAYILDEHGRLRKHMNLFVDGRAVVDRTGLGDAVGPDSEILVFQALSGG